MSLNIFERLLTVSHQAALNECIEYAKKNEPQEVCAMILQFFVDFLSKRYEVATQDLELLETLDHIEELKDLLLEIYQSEKQTDDLAEDPEIMIETIKGFLEKFFHAAFENDLIGASMVISWTNFLTTIVAHPEIPQHGTFKGNTIHLMSLLLAPLCCQATKEEPELSPALMKPVQEAIKAIMEKIPIGFAYKTLCVPIANEFIQVMRSYHDITINYSSNYLFLYKKLLLEENHFLHSMALKSLRSLCYVGEVQPFVAAFLFEDQSDSEEDQETFMEIFQELVGRKNLKTEAMALMKAMSHLSGQHELVGEIRRELYLNVFSGIKKTMTETVDLMQSWGDNLWMEFIQLLHSEANESIELQSFLNTLLTIDGVDGDPKTMLKIVLENLKTPEVSQVAAEIFVELVKRDDDAKQMITDTLDVLLEQCLEDEGTFVLMLECANIIDFETISVFYKAKPQSFSSMIACLLTAFEKFHDLLTLFNIVDVLKKLTKILPRFVLDEIRKVFDKYYYELLGVFDQHNDDASISKLFTRPITKLTVLFENRAWNLMTKDAMKAILIIIQELLQEDDPLYPMIVRFHANYLKHLWARMILNKSLPMDIELLVEGITSFFDGLCQIVDSKQASLKTNGIMLCSLLDIAVMFQPKMCDQSNHKAFQICKLELNKTNVKLIASWVEKLVFGSSKSSNDDVAFIRKLVLLSWIVFCKNYTALPSLTSSEIIIRHYRLNDPLKKTMDLLFEHLMTQKTIFEQTVAIATFNLANQNDLTSFRSFHHSLEDFIQHHYDSVNKRLSVTSTICSFILSKLKMHVDSLKDDDEDRLVVLEYVSIFIKNMDPPMKLKLAAFISKDLDLSEVEQNRLEAFKASLHE